MLQAKINGKMKKGRKRKEFVPVLFVYAFAIAMRYAAQYVERFRQNSLLNDRLAACKIKASNYRPYGNLKAIYVPCVCVCV